MSKTFRWYIGLPLEVSLKYYLIQSPLTCKALIVVQKHVLVLFFQKQNFLSVSVRNSSKDLSTSVTSLLRLGPIHINITCEGLLSIFFLLIMMKNGLLRLVFTSHKSWAELEENSWKWKPSDSSDSDSVELMTPLTTMSFDFHSVTSIRTSLTTTPTP